jgi:predicted ribosomally synthesized six-cysteine peptide SCIFF
MLQVPSQKHKKENDHNMKRIKTLQTRDLAKSAEKGGCGECQTSCQSASKTSCSIANQQCEKCKK